MTCVAWRGCPCTICGISTVDILYKSKLLNIVFLFKALGLDNNQLSQKGTTNLKANLLEAKLSSGDGVRERKIKG